MLLYSVYSWTEPVIISLQMLIINDIYLKSRTFQFDMSYRGKTNTTHVLIMSNTAAAYPMTIQRCFTSLLALFKSYRDAGIVIMKGSVQGSAVQSCTQFSLLRDSNPAPHGLLIPPPLGCVLYMIKITNVRK